MLQRQLLPRKAANSSIMSYCRWAAIWILKDARPEIIDAPLIFIFRMGQHACCLPCLL